MRQTTIMNILLIFVVIVQTWIHVQSRESFSKPATLVLSSNSKNELVVGDQTNEFTKNLVLTLSDSSDVATANENNGDSLRYDTSFDKECMHFDQLAKNIDDYLKVCFDMTNSSWFGGPEQTYQYWPLNKLNLTDVPYVTTANIEAQAVIESYFLNSDGYYVYVDESVPLFLDINGPNPGKMCFTSKVKAPYTRKENRLKFRVCKYENARVAHENAVKDVLGKPTSVADPYLVKNPIWSTWAKYKEDVSTETVLEYANQIVKSGYPLGQLEIDDNWETCYGNAEFNKSRFENIRELVTNLKKMGFKVSLWTHPFINVDCSSFKTASSLGYFVSNTEKHVVTKWWHEETGMIDFTNPRAALWWSSRLKKLLLETGIDTFKFDAGESTWCPQTAVYYDTESTNHPETIVNAYIDTIAEFGNSIEYRTARGVQKHGRFVRMIDKDSVWGWKIGLPTIVTTLLQFNMIGYPFVLPDMIGGNAYNGDAPTDEMYVRWMQANTFMPVVQFSLVPWDFGKEVTEICKRFMDLHQKYSDLIIQLMNNTVSTGAPVNPPIWWIDPTDTTAHSIDDEFLLGEDILVAPVLVEKAVQRDIYLPAGKWRDESRPNTPLIEGRTWLRNYPAGLDTLPWFTRVNENPDSSVGTRQQMGYTVLVTSVGIMFIVKTVMTNL